MSSEALSNDILEKYKNICNGLKKRFFRKPNVTDASQSFQFLAQQCEHCDLLPYAGLCLIAAAKCECSLENLPVELSCLLRSARNFLAAENKNCKLGFANLCHENLQAALSLYPKIWSKLPQNSLSSIGLNLEIIESLDDLGLKDSKDIFLQNALKLSENCLDSNILCSLKRGENFVEKGEYFDALNIYTEISNLLEKSPKSGFHRDTLLKCELNKIFILLILRPSPNKLGSESAKVLEKYIWGDKVEKKIQDYGMSENLFLLLQSLILTCQSVETSNLMYLEGDLGEFLDTFQKELVRTLVKTYCH